MTSFRSWEVVNDWPRLQCVRFSHAVNVVFGVVLFGGGVSVTEAIQSSRQEEEADADQSGWSY